VKFFGYVARNARRNPLRSMLTIGALAVCGFLAMILFAFIDVNAEAARSVRGANRVVVMSAQGFGGDVPIAMAREVPRIDRDTDTNAILYVNYDEKTGRYTPAPKGEGRPAISPMAWVGNKYADDPIPFTQFACDPETFFSVYDELTVPPEQLKTFIAQRDGAIIGRKLAADKKLKVGDPLPLKANFYPCDLDLTVVGIYDGPDGRDLRWCLFNWEYLNERLRRDYEGRMSDNAGTLFVKCVSPQAMAPLCKAVDEVNRSSDTPTRTQTEEAFISMFSEMWGGLQDYIKGVGLAVLGALILICFVSLSMSVRERATEVAVLRAIGFRKHHVLGMVLTESLLVAAVGGLIGTIGTKLFFDFVDVAPLTAGFVPYFVVPWITALMGMAGALAIGFVSGLVPAIFASRVPVVDGLRKVV
jgi:putative ABC transport system permease protein